MANKKLDLIDLKNIAEQPDARGIRIHPKTWQRLMQDVPKQPGGGSGSSGGSNTVSGKQVHLDDTLPEETVQKISK